METVDTNHYSHQCECCNNPTYSQFSQTEDEFDTPQNTNETNTRPTTRTNADIRSRRVHHDTDHENTSNTNVRHNRADEETRSQTVDDATTAVTCIGYFMNLIFYLPFILFVGYMMYDVFMNFISIVLVTSFAFAFITTHYLRNVNDSVDISSSLPYIHVLYLVVAFVSIMYILVNITIHFGGCINRKYSRR